jgi:hypothetical protein
MVWGRLLAASVLALSATALGLAHSAEAANGTNWKIYKTEWSADDERRFGEFVRVIGESGCNSSIDCLRSPANPFLGDDPASLRVFADCADWPYSLRAYYAWKVGLPFRYVNGVSGSAGDIRFSSTANQPRSKRDIVDHGKPANGGTVLDEIRNTVSTATYRTDAGVEGSVFSDFYSPKLAPGSIRAGTVIYDVHGHVAIVFKIDEDGRIHYMDAHPDLTVTRSVYGAQFGQSPARLGGGFKNWRPVRLVGATQRADGSYSGGRIVAAPHSDIPDFSLEQYHGNVPGTRGDGRDAQFAYNDIPLKLIEYVRASVSGGNMSYNPVFELRATMRTLCNDLKDRSLFVNIAINAGIHRKSQPARLPDNIYGTSIWEWELYSTPSRDARIKTAFAAFHEDLGRMIEMWRQRDKRIVYDGLFLDEDLQDMYAEESAACNMTYRNSAGAPVTLDFDQMAKRIFMMSFDPYHCIERRWGATDPAELASCPDGQMKQRWYMAEQRLRNQIDRTYDARMDYTAAELEQQPRGSGVDQAAPVDVNHLISNVGYRVEFQGMTPVGR